MFSLFTQSQPLPTVQNVDVNRYMGTWYEVARFDNRFERGLVGVTATYSVINSKKIRVVNSGYKNTLQGKKSTARGFANVVGPGQLKVFFFWPFGGDYNIIALDTVDYQYALVGTVSREYLWVLSRTPKIKPETYTMLVNKAKELGFDISALIQVAQP